MFAGGHMIWFRRLTMTQTVYTDRHRRFALSLLSALLLIGFVHASLANADQNTRVHTSTTTTVIKESDGIEPVESVGSQPQPPPTVIQESVTTAKFGSKNQSGTSGCKTDELAAEVIKDLKGDCNAWVKDQKANLKDRFLVSSCEETCDDCGLGLKRCAVNGTIHYLLK
jgi:hypothetical protein